MICDFAETYRILDYRELSPLLAATLCFGLRENSRVKMKLSGAKITLDQMLSAAALDSLNLLCWAKTKDAQKGRNKPKSILKALAGEEPNKDELVSFSTPEEWEAYMKSIRG